MFQAIGRAAQRNPDGSFTVKVEIVDDRTNKTVRFDTHTVATLTALGEVVTRDLAKLAASEDDAALNMAIVGQVVGSI